MEHARIISGIHASPCRLVLAATGGGSRIISDLLSVPGASSTVLECVVPYSPLALKDWLGFTPDRNCSEDTALQMAAQAHRRAIDLLRRTSDGSEAFDASALLGVGITAALATNRERKGEDRAFIAIHSHERTCLKRIKFNKRELSRAEQETFVTESCLYAIASTCGVRMEEPPCEIVVVGESMDVSGDAHVALPPDPTVREVVEGHRPWTARTKLGVWTTGQGINPAGILSGSFHPLHAAHVQLATLAAELLDGPVAFEMPLLNADKPPVDYISLNERLKEFTNHMLVVTAAPTFREKSELFPGTTFVVGADTAKRICDPRFYGHSTEVMHDALKAIAARGCSFLVAARRMEGVVTALDDLAVPVQHRSLFREIPTDQFLWDLSSTEIRRGGEMKD